MLHYYKSENGDLKIKVDMGCGSDYIRENGCDGRCEECDYSQAIVTIDTFNELLIRANCYNIDR